MYNRKLKRGLFWGVVFSIPIWLAIFWLCSIVFAQITPYYPDSLEHENTCRIHLPGVNSRVVEKIKRWSIGLRTSAFMFDDDNFRHIPRPFNKLNVGYLVNKYVGLELETGYGRFRTSKDDFTDGSSFSMSNVLLNLQLRYTLNKKLAIYGVYGYGVAFFYDKKYDAFDVLKENVSRCAKYGAGLEYNINESWVVNPEANYLYSDTGKGSSTDTWGWDFSIGLKYKF